MTGAFGPEFIDWQAVRGLVVQRRRWVIHHVGPRDRVRIVQEAAAVGLMVRFVGESSVELRLKAGRF